MSSLPEWAKSADPGLGWKALGPYDPPRWIALDADEDNELHLRDSFVIWRVRSPDGCGGEVMVDFPTPEIAIHVAETIIRGLRGELEVPMNKAKERATLEHAQKFEDTEEDGS